MADDNHPGATAAFRTAMERIQQRFGLTAAELLAAIQNARSEWIGTLEGAEMEEALATTEARLEETKRGLT